MKVNEISMHNGSPAFGHSFRVSICLKNEAGGADIFVSPYSDKTLYGTLNSQIVSILNQGFYEKLRLFLGKTKKGGRSAVNNEVTDKLIKNLREKDTDYSAFPYVHSVYNGSHLAYIVTGGDAVIAENVKGLKNIGKAKADPLWASEGEKNSYIRSLVRIVGGNVRNFVKHDNVLLRSDANKEIMLKAVFKNAGKNSTGTPKYELDKFELHENKTGPVLKPVNANYNRYKHGPYLLEEIHKTLRYHLNKIAGNHIYYNTNTLDRVLNTVKEAP